MPNVPVIPVVVGPLPDWLHATAAELTSFLETSVPAGLAGSPPGYEFDFWIVKALLRATEYWATKYGTMEPSNEGKIVYAITTGHDGVRPGTITEADINVRGFPKGARRGFTKAYDAVQYCDQATWHAAVRRIKELLPELHQRRAEVAVTTRRWSAFSDSLKMQSIMTGSVGAQTFTTSITPLPFPSSVPTPTSLIAIVANHRVEIHANIPQPSNTLNLFSNVEGDEEEPAPLTRCTRYSFMPGADGGPDSPFVEAEIDSSNDLLRVVPFSRLAVTDALPAEQALDLRPIEPANVPNDVINTEYFFWCVFQGRRVGIFQATAEEMESFLPDTLSTARACLTLEEASACWYRNLARGMTLTEVYDVPTIEDEIREGLASTGEETVAAQVLRNALA